MDDLTPGVTPMALGALRLLRPHRLKNTRKMRVGRFFDGGYVMADCFDGVGAAYSLGINDDVSWDLDIASRGIEVFQYDPTIQALPAHHDLFRWRPIWVSGTNECENRRTLESLIAENGHAGRDDLLLKCDIEFGEWLLLQLTPNHVLRQFRQIVMEIHNLGFLASYGDADNVRKAFFNLTASHHVIHVHGNNFGGWQIVGGIPVPATIEVTLVRKDEGKFEPSDEVFPTPLDMPCDSTRADLYLGRFDF